MIISLLVILGIPFFSLSVFLAIYGLAIIIGPMFNGDK